MKQKNRVPLCLEMLEDRWVPATVRFINGNLFVSNPAITAGKSTLTLTQSTPNSWTVKDGGSSLGTYAGVGNLFINGSNAQDSITVNTNALTYSGNLFVNTLNGNDTTSVTGGGVIAGNVNILTGLGNDTVSITGQVSGSTQVTNSSGGSESYTLGNGTSKFLGDVTLIGGSKVSVGTGADTFAGNVTVNSININTPVSVTTGGAATAVIGKNLTITLGSGADTVTLGTGTVNGNVAVTFGSGNDTFNNSGSATIGGNFSLQAGSGNDSVNLGATTISGNASLNMTDGTDTITVAAASSVQGNLTTNLGNGNDTVLVDGAVNGNAFTRLGNGTDTVTFGNAPSGMFNWRSGNGNDSVTFGDATNVAGAAWNVSMQFGTGNDTLTLAGNGTVAAPELLSGFIDMGGPPGGNQFDPTGSTAAGTWKIISPFTVQNV
jgi:hypothetical protein